MVPFKSLFAVFYLPSIVTLALSCISSEIKRYFGRKSWFFHTPVAFNSPFKGFPSECCHPVWCWKTRMVVLSDGEKSEDMYYRLDTIPACDGHTDGQTSCHGIVRTMHTRRAVKMKTCLFVSTENTNVTDRQTDGRTDRQTDRRTDWYRLTA